MSHTPAPWYVVPLSRRDYAIATKDGSHIAMAYDFDGDCEMANQGGKNALLMAAAPDMAEALRAIQQTIESSNNDAAIVRQVDFLAGAALAKAGL
jgi:hypothetical protein